MSMHRLAPRRAVVLARLFGSRGARAVTVRNSLRGGEEALSPAPGADSLTWYSCGPTVYDSAHLGHARTYVCTDIIRRILTDYHSMNVYYAMGITDIDDKIIQRALASGRNWKELAAHFEKDFKDDMHRLNVAPPDVYLPVTDHLPNIISYIQGVIDSGYGYVASDGVYYSVDKFGDRYGCLGHNRGLAEAAAEGADKHDGPSERGKRSARDFALWKLEPSECAAVAAADGPPPRWDSPWGTGRPGWHIECSAMTHACFGPRLDVHSGGIDLLFPHHTNEVAQCVAHNRCEEWTRFWVHTGHLHIDGCKMSKSLKNFISIKDYLSSGWTAAPADDLRIYFLHHKYHSTLHFSRERIEEAAAYRQHIEAFLALTATVQAADGARTAVRWAESPESRALREQLADAQSAVAAALCADFDTPAAVRRLASLVSAALPLVRAAATDLSVPVSSIYASRKFVVSVLSTFGLTFVQNNSHSTGGDLKKEAIAIDHFVQFRSKVRSICVQELKAAKKRCSSGLSESSEEQGALCAVRGALAACDKVRESAAADAGLVISDAAAPRSQDDSVKRCSSSTWYFIDPVRKSENNTGGSNQSDDKTIVAN